MGTMVGSDSRRHLVLSRVVLLGHAVKVLSTRDPDPARTRHAPVPRRSRQVVALRQAGARGCPHRGGSRLPHYLLMLRYMDLEGALSSKGLLAAYVRASKRLVFRVAFPAKVGMLVGAHVFGQISTLPEIFATSGVLAWKRTLARVYSDVLYKIRGLFKGYRV